MGEHDFELHLFEGAVSMGERDELGALRQQKIDRDMRGDLHSQIKVSYTLIGMYTAYSTYTKREVLRMDVRISPPNI